MKKLICLLSITFFASMSFVHADDCKFARVKLTFNKNKKSLIGENEKIRFELLEADGDIRAAEGPFNAYKKPKKLLCSFDKGIFDDTVFYSESKNTVMVKSYSGSCGEFRIYSLKTCKEVGTTASYCGDAKFENNVLTNLPACEPIDDKVQSCSSAHVFKLNSTCTFILDETESKNLTFRTLEKELPTKGVMTIPLVKKDLCKTGAHELSGLLDDYNKTHTDAQADAIIALAKRFDEAKRKNPKGCADSNTFNTLLSHDDGREARALAGDARAIRYLLQLHSFSDGAFSEELEISLGKTINSYPKTLLETLNATQPELFCSEGLVANTGEYDSIVADEVAALFKRKASLMTVTDEALIKRRDVCVAVLDRLIANRLETKSEPKVQIRGDGKGVHSSSAASPSPSPTPPINTDPEPEEVPAR